MKNAAFTSGVILVAVAVTAGAAIAQGPGSGKHGEPVTFGELDTDASGEISLQELQARGSDRFAGADTDSDGKISQAELEVAATNRAVERAAMMMARLDTDGDGSLTIIEISRPKMGERMFKRLDADANGGISEAEFADARHKMGGRRNHGSDKN